MVVRLPKTQYRYLYSIVVPNRKILPIMIMLLSGGALIAEESSSVNAYASNTSIQQTNTYSLPSQYPIPQTIQLFKPVETTTPYFTPIPITEPITSKEIFVHWTPKEIKLNDSPNGHLWRHIPEHIFARHESTQGTGSVKMQWDNKYLYVLFDIADQYVEDSIDSWNGDSVSMIINNPFWKTIHNHRFDINGQGTGRHQASLFLKEGTSINDNTNVDKGFYVLMKIKWSMLKLTAIDGMKIPINLISVNHDGKPGAKHDDPEVRWSKIIWDGGTAQTTNGSAYLMEKGPLMIERIPEEVRWGQLKPDYIRAEKAMYYILSQQIKSTGLFQSYKEEATAHTFDQALVLIDLSMEMEILGPHQQRYKALSPRAKKLCKALQRLQNKDGSWFNAFNVYDGRILAREKYTGIIAWVVFALHRYGMVANNKGAIKSARLGMDYLKTQMKDGALVHLFHDGNVVAVTEANINGWFAFTALGETQYADKIKRFLLHEMWSDQEGRFYAGKNVETGRIDRDPYLDNQTLGAHFLKTIGKKHDAIRTLNFARKTFHVNEQAGKITGLDGRSSNLAVWLGGTFQYITAKGPYAQTYLSKLNRLQNSDGGYPHDSKDLSDPWHTTWTGISSTVWAHQANLGTHPLTVAKKRSTTEKLS